MEISYSHVGFRASAEEKIVVFVVSAYQLITEKARLTKDSVLSYLAAIALLMLGSFAILLLLVIYLAFWRKRIRQKIAAIKDLSLDQYDEIVNNAATFERLMPVLSQRRKLKLSYQRASLVGKAKLFWIPLVLVLGGDALLIMAHTVRKVRNLDRPLISGLPDTVKQVKAADWVRERTGLNEYMV